MGSGTQTRPIRLPVITVLDKRAVTSQGYIKQPMRQILPFFLSALFILSISQVFTPSFAFADEDSAGSSSSVVTTAAAKGKWIKSGGKWYYQNASGSWAKGWIRPDGKTWYFLDSQGVMQTGWLKRGKTWYYLNGSGAMATGWKKIKGAWYYLDTTSGAMKTGWVRPDGKTWYFLNSNGVMQTGWLKRGKTWYYLSASGAMQTGWQKIKGTWYYLNKESGAMYANRIVGGYYLDPSGAMISQSLRSYISTTKTAQTTSQIVLVVGHQLTLWKKQKDNTWVNYMDAYCGYGRNGMDDATKRKEGDGTTPIGSFPIPYAFGNAKNPGTLMSYYPTTSKSYWSAEKASYNKWVESSTPIYGEHLSSIYQYKYAAVIGFNMNPTIYGRGSAFFLHCKSKNTWATAGCVSLAEADMVRALKLLENGAYIMIVPNKSSITSY